MIRTVKSKKRSELVKYIALVYAVLLVGVDQLIKYLVEIHLMPVDTVGIIPDALHLTYMRNYGAAFSSMQGRYWFLIIFTSAALLAGIIWICMSKKNTPRMLIWSLATIIGGGLGNLLDRVFRGFVVDYIDFRLINFAVFNFADICVVCGTAVLACYIVFSDFGKKGSEKKAR